MNDMNLPIITKSKLIQDLTKLGLRPNQVVMLHVSVKAIGWIVGGPDIIIQSILDILTSEGTLMMLIGWEDSPYDLQKWPHEKQQAYFKECPPFDPQKSHAYHKWSILTEYLRTWPETYRSDHPEASFVAVGKLAEWITKDHPLQYGYGPRSPLEKLEEIKGKILIVGSPLKDITLLHYSEHIAKVSDKPIIHYKMPIIKRGKRCWIEIEEFDTTKLIGNWSGKSYFEIIPIEFLASGRGISGTIGNAQSHLFDASTFNKFAIKWLESHLT